MVAQPSGTPQGVGPLRVIGPGSGHLARLLHLPFLGVVDHKFWKFRPKFTIAPEAAYVCDLLWSHLKSVFPTESDMYYWAFMAGLGALHQTLDERLDVVKNLLLAHDQAMHINAELAMQQGLHTTLAGLETVLLSALGRGAPQEALHQLELLYASIQGYRDYWREEYTRELGTVPTFRVLVAGVVAQGWQVDAGLRQALGV